jgi:multidrug resistance efflux pump
MHVLKRRSRADNIPSDLRVVHGRTGRVVYLALLAIFALTAADYLFGDLLLLRADGLLLSDQNIIATTYVAQVDAINVKEGQSVTAGTPLLKLHSTELLEHLADLSTKRADIAAKRTDLKLQAENVTQLLPLAERRVAESDDAIKHLDALSTAKLVTPVRYEEALRLNYEASRDRVNLLTQRKVLDEELSSLTKALRDADEAMTKLQDIYMNGIVRTPVSGNIGASVPSVGTVYRPGEPILSVYTGKPYVLMFLPRRYLLPISIGMRLRINDGHSFAYGEIAEILPVTDALPKEFQNTFKPTDRNQLAKIDIEGGAPFPLKQKVYVTRFPTVLDWLLKSGGIAVAAPARPAQSVR